jgi:hypothetical protein
MGHELDPLPAGVRFRRARAMLNPAVPDQAALAASMDAEAATADVAKLDLASARTPTYPYWHQAHFAE